MKKSGKHAQGTICYTTSPLHTTDQFVAMAQRLLDLGCDSICIKDMAALLKPQPAYDIVKGIKEACGQDVRVQVHVHATTGVTHGEPDEGHRGRRGLRRYGDQLAQPGARAQSDRKPGGDAGRAPASPPVSTSSGC